MFTQGELITLILSLFVIGFLIYRKNILWKIPRYKLLVASFLIFTAAYLFTNLEAVFFENLFNILEHTFYLVSILLLLLWAYFYGVNERKNNSPR
jgi:hypothetical protein